jgi:hypothetical protein
MIQQSTMLDVTLQSAEAKHQKIAALPHHTRLSTANSEITDEGSALATLVGRMDTVDRSGDGAPATLGYSSPRRYFVGFQNEAVERGSSGLPGALGIVVAHRHTVTIPNYGTACRLRGDQLRRDKPDYYVDRTVIVTITPKNNALLSGLLPCAHLTDHRTSPAKPRDKRLTPCYVEQWIHHQRDRRRESGDTTNGHAKGYPMCKSNVGLPQAELIRLAELNTSLQRAYLPQPEIRVAGLSVPTLSCM